MFEPTGDFTNYSAAQDASQARADAREAQTKAELLQRDIERLLAITEALWLFIKTHHDHTDKDLVKVLSEIQERDKQAPKNQPVECPQCKRMNSGRQAVCIYCNGPLPIVPFAR